MSLPPQNQEQRDAALAVANTRRLDAADVKREIAAGELTLKEAMDDPRAGVIRIGALLRSVKYVGEYKTMAVLFPLRISDQRRVRDLTDRQKLLIARAARPQKAMTVRG